MRHIDLMTYYRPQPYIEGVTPFICIRSVEWDEKKHLTITKGNVNFTDLWFAMSEAAWEQDGKYSSQQIGLLGDEENDWKKAKGSLVLIVLMKIGQDEAFQKNVCMEIKQGIGNCKIFYTLADADRIIFCFAQTENELGGMKDFIEKYKEENDFYMVSGKLDMDDSGVIIIKDIKKVSDEGSIPRKEIKDEKGWCANTRSFFQNKMRICIEDKNKKWNSYYQSLYQIVNLLESYEQYEQYKQDQQNRPKDLFYVLFPAFQLFLEQLKKGEELLERMGKESNDLEKIGEKYVLAQKIENSVSDFIDNMELLVHHIGIGGHDMLDLNGNNGLAYDVPMHLILLYISALYEITTILNDDDYQYQFLFSPVAYARPKTKIFEFGLEPEDRLLQISVARHQMYSPRALLAILAHECGHYTNEEARLRTKRAEAYINISTIALLSELLPDEKLEKELEREKVCEKAKELLRDDWKERKERLFDICGKKIIRQVMAYNVQRKHKYHFEDLYEDVQAAIKDYILCDSQGMLRDEMNRCTSALKQYLFVHGGDKKVAEVLGKEYEWLEEKTKALLASRRLFEELDIMKSVLKEVFADCVSIQLLDLDAANYLESFLLSESYVPDTNVITNSLLNRVALIHMIMREDKKSQWNISWNRILKAQEDDNGFLLNLIKQVELYIAEYKWAKKGYTISLKQEEMEQEAFDIFMVPDIIEYELAYLKEANMKIKSHIKRNEIKGNRERLRDVYDCFKVSDVGHELPYDCFFERLDELVKDYKDNVVKIWEVANSNIEKMKVTVQPRASHYADWLGGST